MITANLTFRETLKDTDPETIRGIVKSTNFFYQDEVEVAVELAKENLGKGAEQSGYYFILAESGAKVLGYTCFGPIPCTKKSFDLYWIAVHEDYRHLGLGRKLIHEAEKKIQALGGDKVYVETSSRDLYLPIRRFYLGCGYQVEALLKDFYDLGDDKVVFVKSLG